MEPKFQTSFIPKKQVASVGGLTGNSMGSGPMQQKARSSLSSLYMAFASIVFVISILAVGGAFFWKSYLTTANKKYKEDLFKKEQQFDTALIQKLKAKNIQIDSAKKLMNNHIAVSNIFDVIEKMTVSDVRFMSMDLKGTPENGANYTLTLKGLGKNLPTVAFQSSVFADLSKIGLDKSIKNPIVSNPSLDLGSAVSFGFSADVIRDTLSYKKFIDGENK